MMEATFLKSNEEMGRWLPGKGLICKHKEQILDPQNPCQSQAGVAAI